MAKSRVQKYCKKCGKEISNTKVEKCPYCKSKLKAVDYEQLNAKQKQENQEIINQKRKEEDVPIIASVIIILVVVIGCCIINIVFSHVDSDEKSTEEMLKEERMKECETNSNAYYKCGWNILEDRCTCKAR